MLVYMEPNPPFSVLLLQAGHKEPNSYRNRQIRPAAVPHAMVCRHFVPQLWIVGGRAAVRSELVCVLQPHCILPR